VRAMLAELERSRRDIRIVVVGSLDGAPDSAYLTVTGAYERSELVDRIEANGINVIFFPSICPETFSYVVEEMMLLAVPIVAFDLGAPGERLRDYPNAVLCQEVSASAALDAIVELHARLALQLAPAA
jgi:glycosyltransferase involved in cell wall biosynthesis